MTEVGEAVANVARADHGRIIAMVMRTFGDLELAEDAVQDALRAALERWPVDGIPLNPTGWVLTVARRKAIDRLRRASTLERKQALLVAQPLEEEDMRAPDGSIEDDRLRLIFICCHPALAPEARVALTLRMVGGLTSEEIAAAFLVPEPTLAKRLVRAKQKIKQAGIPYRLPRDNELDERLDAVLVVIYLIFNAGYAAPHHHELVRIDLCDEAIRLGRVLDKLMPDDAEVLGLLAMMLLHHSRHGARVGLDSQARTLEEQDRSLWNQTLVREGLELAERIMRAAQPGPYQTQAIISATHARAASAADTDWVTIVRLYDRLLDQAATPVAELNRAVAVGMAEGAAQGLLLLDNSRLRDELDTYYLYHAARADLLRRLGHPDEAAIAYERARQLASNVAERSYFDRRIDELRDSARRDRPTDRRRSQTNR
jgi:RNA polymerase sigma-70 factor (ECF subfamily)